MKQSIYISGIFAIICCILFQPIIISEAATVDGTDDIAVPSSFDASYELIGEGLQIKIPAEFNPTYREDERIFCCESQILVAGSLAPDRRLAISTGEEILYTTDDENGPLVYGTVQFGTNGVQYWTSEELLTGEISKPVVITVDRRDILVPAVYHTSIIFSFEIEKSTNEGSISNDVSANDQEL